MKYSMLDYIQRQPEILTKAYNEKELFLNTFDEIFANNPIKRIYFVGSGTSFHVSSLGAIWFNKYLNVEASAHFPTIFVEEKINKTKNTITIKYKVNGIDYKYSIRIKEEVWV